LPEEEVEEAVVEEEEERKEARKSSDLTTAFTSSNGMGGQESCRGARWVTHSAGTKSGRAPSHFFKEGRRETTESGKDQELLGKNNIDSSPAVGYN
jgi:hypothetical protein